MLNLFGQIQLKKNIKVCTKINFNLGKLEAKRRGFLKSYTNNYKIYCSSIFILKGYD